MARGHEIKQIDIILNDGTMYTMTEADIVSVEISLEYDFDTAWHGGVPISDMRYSTAHMHLHLISQEMGVHMQETGLRALGVSKLELKDWNDR